MNHTSPSSVPKKEEMESLVVMFFARRLFLEDKTGFQTGPRHGFFDLLPSFFSSWSDPGERFDRTRKKLACFPGAQSIRVAYQPRGGAWEEILPAPPFLPFVCPS